MTTLYLIRGLPGSGKSSLAQDLENIAIRVEADDFFLDHEGNYNFDATNLKQAHEYCYMNAQAALNISEGVKNGKVQTIIIPSNVTAIGSFK